MVYEHHDCMKFAVMTQWQCRQTRRLTAWMQAELARRLKNKLETLFSRVFQYFTIYRRKEHRVWPVVLARAYSDHMHGYAWT